MVGALISRAAWLRPQSAEKVGSWVDVRAGAGGWGVVAVGGVEAAEGKQTGQAFTVSGGKDVVKGGEDRLLEGGREDVILINIPSRHCRSKPGRNLPIDTFIRGRNNKILPVYSLFNWVVFA